VVEAGYLAYPAHHRDGAALPGVVELDRATNAEISKEIQETSAVFDANGRGSVEEALAGAQQIRTALGLHQRKITDPRRVSLCEASGVRRLG
jgi:hypothetical protein